MFESEKNGANRGARYERSDASAPGVLGALIGLALFVFMVGLSVKAGFGRLKSRYAGQPVQLGAFAPPPPRLQIDEAIDLRHYLTEQKRWLETYGKTPTGQRIPIERAMEILSHE